ncbi:MAG: hypothetical protein JSW00_17205 [Thermoplasmata archaeon]|nr:MAG: hypothetical protein JSW00_17205 [Thermoplasmata archaeon]
MLGEIKTKPSILLGIICVVIGIVFLSIAIVGEISKSLEKENEETSEAVTNRPTDDYTDDYTNCVSGGVFFLVIGFALIVIGKSQSQQQKLSKQILEHLQQQPQSRQCNNCKKQIPIDSNLCPYCGNK